MFCESIDTAFFLDPDALQAVFPVKDEESALLLFGIIIRIDECRMGSDLKIEFTV